MFVLDTNVLSAAMSTRPAPEVAIWMARHPPELLFTTAVCFAARRSAGRPQWPI